MRRLFLRVSVFIMVSLWCCMNQKMTIQQLELGSQEAPYASHLETEVKRPRCNQCQAARAGWVWCRPSTLWRNPKTNKLACSCRRRAQPFLLIHCHSKDNWACLPGPLCNSGWKEATCSMQAARWARTWNCSRSLNLAANFNASELPSLTSWADLREDLNQSPLTVLDTTPFKTEKSCKRPYGILGQMVLCPSVYIILQPWSLTLDEERYHSPFTSTLRLSTRISLSKPVFQWTSGSPDQAYIDPCYLDVDNRPVYGPLAFGLSKLPWRGILEVPDDGS